jgi:hypothetical protein
MDIQDLLSNATPSNKGRGKKIETNITRKR